MELLATQADYLQLIHRTYVNANSEQKITDPFRHYPRPGVLAPASEPTKTVSLSGFAGLLKEKI